MLCIVQCFMCITCVTDMIQRTLAATPDKLGNCIVKYTRIDEFLTYL